MRGSAGLMGKLCVVLFVILSVNAQIRRVRPSLTQEQID